MSVTVKKRKERKTLPYTQNSVHLSIISPLLARIHPYCRIIFSSASVHILLLSLFLNSLSIIYEPSLSCNLDYRKPLVTSSAFPSSVHHLKPHSYRFGSCVSFRRRLDILFLLSFIFTFSFVFLFSTISTLISAFDLILTGQFKGQWSRGWSEDAFAGERRSAFTRKRWRL